MKQAPKTLRETPRHYSTLINRRGPAKWQAGGLTIFTGVFVLILMT